MNVGILTFINTTNYGAELQAFALQNSIQKLGFQVEILQYSNEKIEKKESNSYLFSVRSIIKRIIMGSGIKRKIKAFRDFEKEYFICGKELITENYNEVNDYYDRFVAGSDQIWNMNITHKDWKYFLDFVKDNDKKISYAPSFGNVMFPKECYEELREKLRQFHAVSVRENAGKKFIESICEMKAEVVADPTLLLDKKDWEKLISFKPELEHYILVYFPHDKKMVFDFVEQLKRDTGLPVVYLSISPKPWKGVTTIYDASPEQFLGWVLYADYVVTGSFHGTAFSLNFEKDFFYEPSGEGSRIDNLVRICGVLDRSIANGNISHAPIDYSRVSKIIAEERERSLSWLKNSLLGE